MESSGTNFKNLKKILGQTLKSQVKKGNLILLYTHFQKFITMKKNHTNKKTYILIPMIPLYLIISKRNKQ